MHRVPQCIFQRGCPAPSPAPEAHRREAVQVCRASQGIRYSSAAAPAPPNPRCRKGMHLVPENVYHSHAPAQPSISLHWCEGVRMHRVPESICHSHAPAEAPRCPHGRMLYREQCGECYRSCARACSRRHDIVYYYVDVLVCEIVVRSTFDLFSLPCVYHVFQSCLNVSFVFFSHSFYKWHFSVSRTELCM